MTKLMPLFVRGPDGRYRDEVTPGAEWVQRGEGRAFRDQYRIWMCKVEGGRLYRSGEGDGEWIEVGPSNADRIYHEAFEAFPVADGFYELVGPKAGVNPDRLDTHMLVPNHYGRLFNVPTDFDGLRDYLAATNIRIVTWQHKARNSDAIMVNVKAIGFGIKRG